MLKAQQGVAWLGRIEGGHKQNTNFNMHVWTYGLIYWTISNSNVSEFKKN